ncbi:MAG TPA: ThuA domain-containing protein [Gemmatales bacterium]|nr:ThuA domain-containing protein [Gemmatales bacterium]
MHRRDLLRTVTAATLASTFPFGWTSAATSRASKKLLCFTRSQGFQHDVVNRNKPDGKKFLGEKGKLSHVEHLVTEWGKVHGFEVTCTKDGRIFVPDEIEKFDAFFFYTTGDLTQEKSADNTPPMPPDGKKALLDAIASGKGFIGSHCASDTFHSPGDHNSNQPVSERDPYIQMLGGEFIVHGEQFKATMKVSSDFRAIQGLQDFDMHEEWYSLKNFSKDLHVILAQDSSTATESWKQSGNPKRVQGGNAFHIRPLHPATWARQHGKGRVFYTSMGHREDVWTNDIFQKVFLGGLNWVFRQVDADITPNIDQVTPQASVLRS